jgi:hypothetical protein
MEQSLSAKLENQDECGVIRQNISLRDLSHIFLSHISAENNTIGKALSVFSQVTQNVTVLPTPYHTASGIVRL